MRPHQGVRQGGFVEDTTPITSTDEIKEILRSAVFVQGGHGIAAEHFIRDTRVLLDGGTHVELRRREAPLFTASAIDGFHRKAVVPVITRALEAIAADVERLAVLHIDLVPLSWSIVHQVAARVVGIDGVDGPGRAERFIECVRQFGEALTVEFSGDRESVLATGHSALDVLLGEFIEPSARRRRELVRRVVDGALRAEALDLDLLTLLYLETDEWWDDELPLREAALFTVGSTQTTAHALPHLVVLLEQWCEAHPGRRSRISADPEFLRRAANESLRFFVAAPARLRLASRDIVLSSGRQVSAGERLALYFLPANSGDRSFGSDTDRFNPDREGGRPPWGLAFGSGAHVCPGRPLVTGYGPNGSPDGTLATAARELYKLGLRLDPNHAPVRVKGTDYNHFSSVPIVFTR
jgi:cytochrome P450